MRWGSTEKGNWHHLASLALDSLGLPSSVLESSLEGQLSEYIPPPAEGGAPIRLHPYAASNGEAASLPRGHGPSLPSVPSVQTITPESKRLDKAQQQPSASCFPVSATVKNLRELDHSLGYILQVHPQDSVSKIPTSRTTLQDLLESLTWSEIILGTFSC